MNAVEEKKLRGHETVLLVDDDNAVRQLCSLILSHYGYSILEADSAAAAMKVWNEKGAEVDMLVTDMVMPGASGLDLATMIRAQRPEMRVLVISGYSAKFFGAGLELPKSVSFLAKPFSPQELAGMVRQCLDAPIELAHA